MMTKEAILETNMDRLDFKGYAQRQGIDLQFSFVFLIYLLQFINVFFIYPVKGLQKLYLFITNGSISDMTVRRKQLIVYILCNTWKAQNVQNCAVNEICCQLFYFFTKRRNIALQNLFSHQIGLKHYCFQYKIIRLYIYIIPLQIAYICRCSNDIEIEISEIELITHQQ